MHTKLIVGDDGGDDSLVNGQVNELSRKLTAEQMLLKVPKIQVSEKGGKMFALNNSSLQLMIQLEKQGNLPQGMIRVELVPLSKVPANIQMAMIADNDLCVGDYNSKQEQNGAINQTEKKREHTDISHDLSNKSKINSEADKVNGAQGSSQTIINQNSDEDSDREENDEEDEEEEDGNEDRSNGSSSSDDTMQCNVCDRVFSTARLLARHQMKKKHFGCSVCETVFPSLLELEEHKQILDHWSDEDNPLTECEAHNTIFKLQREELERLL